MSRMQFENSHLALIGKPGKSAGFTLTELLTVVVVVAILAAIAVPSYQNFIRKAARRQAQADLVEYAQMAERHYTVNRTYQGFNLPNNQSPRQDNMDAKYQLSISTTAGSGTTMSSFVIKATPVAAQSSDNCGTMTLNQAGVKTSSGAEVAECW